MKNKSGLFRIVLLLILLPSMPSMAAGFKDSRVIHIEHPDWFIHDPFVDLSEILSNAKLQGKQGIMVLYTTEGCSYCDLFIKRSLGDSAIKARMQKHFDVVGLEIFDDQEMTGPQGNSMSVKQFARKEGAGMSPTMLFYDTDGKRVTRIIGYQSPERFTTTLDYVTGKHYQNMTLAQYVARQSDKTAMQTSAKLIDDELFGKPPYALDRSHFAASQPLLVIFEKPGCDECKNFHTLVLALPEVRQTLEKFEVVRLDATDSKTPVITPDGKRVNPADWFRQTSATDVPALLFFEEKGKEVLKVDTQVLRQRMMNSLNYVLERAYEKGWSYQRFARSRAIARRMKQQQNNKQ